MLKTGWIIGIVMAFVVLSLIAGIAQMGTPLEANEVARLQVFFNPSITNVVGWLGNFWGMLWFDYPSIFHGAYAYVRYIIFIPVGIGMSIALAITLAQLLATAVSGIGRLFFR